MLSTLTPHLSEAEIALLPTEKDIAFYEEHGWYVSPKVLTDEIIDQAVLGSKRFYQGERDQQLPTGIGFSDWKPSDGDDVVRNNEFVSLQNRELRTLGLQPIIGAIAARLSRSTEIRLLDDQLVYKPPQDKNGKGAVGWHADRAYWSTCSSHNLLTAWIPFHDCQESRGSLVVLDKSHKWTDIQDSRYFNNHNLQEIEDKFRDSGKEVVRVPISLEKGQISFHHCWTIHGSLPNYSNSFRLAMAIHLQDGDNHYQPFWDNTGKEIHIADEFLCRKLENGYPDFRDPDIFPVLWDGGESSMF
ncbi:MAG: phytanoyl-CoA dioxygenase family protein [Cyanobacteria bacterium P01_A01_bin.84]